MISPTPERKFGGVKHAAYLWRTVLFQVSVSSVPLEAHSKILVTAVWSTARISPALSAKQPISNAQNAGSAFDWRWWMAHCVWVLLHSQQLNVEREGGNLLGGCRKLWPWTLGHFAFYLTVQHSGSWETYLFWILSQSLRPQGEFNQWQRWRSWTRKIWVSKNSHIVMGLISTTGFCSAYLLNLNIYF